MKPQPILWIEGIIGAGKSTLTETLATQLGLKPYYEPVQSNPYLDDFYKDPSRWAFAMQVHLLRYRYGVQKISGMESLLGHGGAILDRGLPGDRVFAKQNFLMGHMSRMEWDTYEGLYNMFAIDVRAPSLLLFLDVSPKTAFCRLKSRGRECEEFGVDLGYLEFLREGYLDLLREVESGNHVWSQGMSILHWPWDGDHMPVTNLVQELRRRLWGVSTQSG